MPQSDWQRLVRYLRDCVKAEKAVAKFPAISGYDFVVVDLTEEQLVRRSAETIAASKQAMAFVAGNLGQQFFYGWPVLVFDERRDGTTVRRLGALFTAEIAVTPANTVGLVESPTLNVPLLAAVGYDQSEIAAAEAQIVGEWPENPAAVDALVARVLDVLALTLIAETMIGAAPSDLGLVSTAFIFMGDDNVVVRKLLEELSILESRTDYGETAAGLLITKRIPDHVVQGSHPTASPLPATDAQEQCAHEIRANALTVVTGPPGTGKSQLVVAAVTNAILDNETVLVASYNNAAVDVAVDRMTEIHPTMVVRGGNQAARLALKSAIPSVIAAAKGASPQLVATARAALDRAAKERTSLHRDVDELSDSDDRLLELSEEHVALIGQLWPSGPPPPMTAQARRKILRLRRARFFGGVRRRRMLQRAGVSTRHPFTALVRWAELQSEIPSRIERRERLAAQIGNVGQALRLSDSKWVECSERTIVETVKLHADAAKGAITALAAAPGGGKGFASALSTAMKGLRAVAVTNLSVGSNLPLKAGVVDLVVLDEASQCDLASALPVLYRAKRAAIVGDPNQLTPIVTLPKQQGAQIAMRHGLDVTDLEMRGLDYNSGSVYKSYEHIVGNERVKLLDDHFRCHPLIARWFNTVFYGGQLRVLTNVASMIEPPAGLIWVDVLGGATRKGPGGRSVVNDVEAGQVVEFLGSLVGMELSVGVVSPFVAQANRIRDLAVQQYGAEQLGGIDFVAATAHRFQGNERDIMLFSSTIAPNSAPRTAKWVEQTRNLLNVAASRGRRALIVFGDPNAARDLGVATLASIRELATTEPDTTVPTFLLHSDAERRLYDAMIDRGLNPVPKPQEHGFELDFGMRTPGGRLVNIEVDGPHHDEGGKLRRQDVARDLVLESVGYTVIRIPAWRCHYQPANVSAEIVAALRDLDIIDDPPPTTPNDDLLPGSS